MNRLSHLQLGLVVILLAWLLAGTLSLTSPLFFPELPRVLSALLGEVQRQDFWRDVWTTLFRSLAGLALSTLVGVPLGLLLGRSKSLYHHVRLPLDFIRSIPSATLFPLFILIFGIGHESKIAVAFYGGVFIIAVATLYAARDTPETKLRIAMMRSLRANQSQVFKLVIIPGALPGILGGLKIAASVSLVLVVVTEMFLGSNEGLGKAIYDTYLAYQIPKMFALLIVLGMIGYLINTAIERIEEFYRTRS